MVASYLGRLVEKILISELTIFAFQQIIIRIQTAKLVRLVGLNKDWVEEWVISYVGLVALVQIYLLGLTNQVNKLGVANWVILIRLGWLC